MSKRITSIKSLNLDSQVRVSVQNGSIPLGLTSSQANFPLNMGNTSLFAPNDYFGPTYSPYYPIDEIRENYTIKITGDWRKKIKTGNKITLVRGSIVEKFNVIKNTYFPSTNSTILNFSTNRKDLPSLDPFIGASGYPYPATDSSLKILTELETKRESLLKDFNVKIVADPLFASKFSATFSWETDPSVSVSKIRVRTKPRVSANSILSFSLNSTGKYSQVPIAEVLDDKGRGAKIQLTSTISGVNISTGGTGYTTASVQALGGGGTGASFSVGLSGSSISTVNISSGGTGYDSLPQLLITGDGTGAICNVSEVEVTGLYVIQQGGGYYTSPVVEIDDTYQTGLTAASVSSSLNLRNVGRIDHVRVLNNGSGYTGASVTISPIGASGTGASARANVDLFSEWIYSETLTQKTYTFNKLERGVPYIAEILLSTDSNFREYVSYEGSLEFQYIK